MQKGELCRCRRRRCGGPTLRAAPRDCCGLPLHQRDLWLMDNDSRHQIKAYSCLLNIFRTAPAGRTVYSACAIFSRLSRQVLQAGACVQGSSRQA